MKKKLLSLFVALAMCITLIVGCNNSDDNKKPSGDDEPEVPPTTTPVQLTAPTVTLTDNVISWSAVENASGYTVYEGETAVSTAQTQLKYTIEKTESGSWTYTVVAVSGDTTKYTNSNASNEVTYKYTKPEEKPEEKPTVDTSTKLQGKIYLVGDSTVSAFDDGGKTGRYLPRYGYGTQIYNYVNCDEGQVQNLALSGRSSYSFTKEGNYQTLISNIGEGDYLIIGFGHNDQKDAIYTNPNLTSSDDSLLTGTPDADKHYASFKYTLKTFYIDVAKQAKATPILCTPIVRASDKNDYTGKNGHKTDTSDGEAYPGGDYPKAIRELATECGITCIDLTQSTADEYKQIGYDEAVKYHSFSGAKFDTDGTTVKLDSGTVDKTHTNLYGAKMNAYRIATALLNSDNSLKAHIRTNLAKPEYDVEFPKCINKDYDVAANSTYNPFNPETDKSAKWSVTADGWYGTAFGDVSISKCTITQTADPLSFTIGTESGGKITGGGDGFPAVFKQLGAEANFIITADVTISSYGADAQPGFGIMLRDDMYIDKGSKSVLPKSNYVVAGCYGTASSANMNFFRDKGTLTSSGKTGVLDTTPTTVHKLSLERTGTTIIAKFDGYTYDSGADFELKAVDGQYMYLCLFATRATTVTFSNIVFTDKGVSEA